MLKRRLHLLVLPVLAVGLIFGLSRLFKLRFDHGDVYPHYSSYRSDPVGSKVFYQALEELPDFDASRFHEPRYRKLPHGKDHTLIALQVKPWTLMKMYYFSIENLELFMRQGGRMVIGVTPYPTQSFLEVQFNKQIERERQKIRSKNPEKGQKKEEKKDKEFDLENPADIKDFVLEDESERKGFMDDWGIRLEWESLDFDEDFVVIPATAVLEESSPRELPGALEWHSAGVFKIPEELEDSWTVHYRRGDFPVVIERQLGEGSIVLTTDPYVFSNEALQENRHTGLLSWYLSDHRNIIFDESHFGMVRQDGVASLGRKYQLHGLALALVVLGLLFVWKNSTSLVPPLDDLIAAGAVTGRDSNAGFLNLLRRTIKPRKLIAVCISEWRKSHPHQKEKGEALLRASEFDRPQNDLVGRYHELREVVKPRIK
ncbi:MAG: DUF4350 domain-containing protein [Limisphaerales bacterium]